MRSSSRCGRCPVDSKRKIFILILAVCDGKCSSGTRYISEPPFYESRCSCCLPMIDASKDIILKCPDGTNKLHRITEVSACECRSCGNAAAAPPAKDKTVPSQ